MQREKIIEIYIKGKEKSDEDYEKLIGYVAAGTIVLSISFIEKIVPLKGADFLWILILAWTCLAATLVTNLISHQKSSEVHQSCIELLQDSSLKEDEIYACIAAKNKPLENFNRVSSIGLCAGVISLIVFCSINIYTMQKKDTEIKPLTQDSDSFEKGRTVIPLRPDTGNNGNASTQPVEKPNATPPSSNDKKQ